MGQARRVEDYCVARWLQQGLKVREACMNFCAQTLWRFLRQSRPSVAVQAKPHPLAASEEVLASFVCHA